MYKTLKITLLSLFIILTPFIGKADISSELPYTWRMQIGNSIMVTTLHEDGTLTSMTCFGCFNCSGSGMCQVCQGTGGQFWPGMGMMACGACFGTGRCGGCGGKGYTVQSSTTQYGVTVVYDEHGHMYIEHGPGGSSSSGKASTRNKVEVIEYLPTYGAEGNKHVYCPKCGTTGTRHVHVYKSY